MDCMRWSEKRGWHTGSWIEVRGPHSNMLYKGSLTKLDQDVVPLSLDSHTPVSLVELDATVISPTPCDELVLEVTRTYGSASVGQETVAITNQETGELLWSDDGSLVTEKTTRFCIAPMTLNITMTSVQHAWAQDSYLYVRLVYENTTNPLNRLRIDDAFGFAHSVLLPIVVPILPSSRWYYSMGSVPADWTSDSVSGWNEATIASFPSSPNQIQLFKRFFDVEDVSAFVGYEVSIRLRYGCVITLNGEEVYRRGVDGVLTDATLATKSYEALLYRRITLPLGVIGEGGVKPRVKEGRNWIAVAVVAPAPDRVECFFDLSPPADEGDGESSIRLHLFEHGLQRRRLERV